MIRQSLLVIVLVACACHPASAAYISGPIQWTIADGGNDHYYALFVTDDINWTDARDAAAGLSFLGSSGHLVTITSSAESNFLESHFSSYIGDPNNPGGIFPPVPGIRAWIGLTDVISEGNFQWVTGESFSYSNWAPPEPNNLGNEDFVWLWRRDFGGGPLWSWNDAANSQGPADGFFVEFDGPFLQPVPEPTSLFLFGLGAVGMTVGAARRRRD
jgi:hypothetical protein